MTLVCFRVGFDEDVGVGRERRLTLLASAESGKGRSVSGRMSVRERGADAAVAVAAVVLRLERVQHDAHDALHQRRQRRLVVPVLRNPHIVSAPLTLNRHYSTSGY